MASSHRRKVRRYLLGATQKATRVWWIGQVTVRVMDVSRRFTTRPVHVKAHYGAEKSSLAGKGSGGLRNPVPATQTKALSSRKANHSFRKEQWALRASNKLRKACERFNRIPPPEAERDLEGNLQFSFRRRRREVFAMVLVAKWQRLHTALDKLGLPSDLWLHSSFREWRMIETSKPYDDEYWYSIVEGLPLPPYVPDIMEVHHTLGVRGRRVVIRHYVEEGSVIPTSRRACRACGYFGRGPHEWNACRPRQETNRGGGHRRGRGRGRGRGRARAPNRN